MNEIIELLKEKIKIASIAITETSSCDDDIAAAQAIEYLTKSIDCLCQIKEREV